MQSIITAAKKYSAISVAAKLVVFVAVVLTIAAVSIPNLLRSRIAANEASAVGSIRTLNTALASYSEQHPGDGFPQNLSDLAPYVDAPLASGAKSGYSFRYRPGAPDIDGVVRRYKVEAQPVAADKTGTRRFSATENAVIKYQISPTQSEQPLDGESHPEPARPPVPQLRKVVRKASLNLIVADPTAAAEKVRNAAYRVGGYVESMRSSDDGSGVKQVSLVVRAPSPSFDQYCNVIKAIAERVTNEEDDARDVTSQYVDLESNLRNFHAEEAQYLEIMRRSGSIKDTLAVAERLADVRGRIERTQGQLNVMSHQTEMSALELTLSTEPTARPVDVRWHPRAEIKAAISQAADDLTTYADFMIAVLFRLPVFALWSFTVVIAAIAGWRLLRWIRRRFVLSALPTA